MKCVRKVNPTWGLSLQIRYIDNYCHDIHYNEHQSDQGDHIRPMLINKRLTVIDISPRHKADIWHLRSCAHASSRSITDLHTVSAHATGSQVSEMFSTWSATDALSTAASSDSPAAKRRRISESTHGRRTSKATRACDVCKVKTSLFVVPHCDLLSALAVPDVAHVADGYHHHVCASHMPYLL